MLYIPTFHVIYILWLDLITLRDFQLLYHMRTPATHVVYSPHNFCYSLVERFDLKFFSYFAALSLNDSTPASKVGWLLLDRSFISNTSFINQFMKIGGIRTWKELTTGVQLLIKLLFNNNVIIPGLIL